MNESAGRATPTLKRSRRLLRRLHAESLYRTRLTLESPQARTVKVDNTRLLCFCSNNYLGLANHPALIEAAKKALDDYGVGTGASHLVTGHNSRHAALESELAEFVHAERALLMSTGYMANLALAQVFSDRHQVIFEDKLNHASLLDAAMLSRARLRRYPHNDIEALKRMMKPDKPGRSLILSDAVFSMDGDLAPIPELLEVTTDVSLLVVDDAHGFGVLGGGLGTLEHFGIRPQGNVLLMATLGKALGSFGAFVAGDSDLIESLIQTARPYIYTTALPTAVVEAARAALRLVSSEPWRRDRLRSQVTRFRDGAAQLGLKLSDSETPIQPIILGTPERALRASDCLRRREILVTAIRPPTVPIGTARLRVTFSAEHTDNDVDRLLDALDRSGVGNE